MQKANHMVWGMLIGLVLPALAWFAGGNWFTVTYLNKPGMPYLITIALNLILLRIAYKKGADQAGNGIMLCTFVFMLAVFLIKLKH